MLSKRKDSGAGGKRNFAQAGKFISRLEFSVGQWVI
jgi:hypothetical protein